ncbi:MAG: septum formation initiator family protein [Candidatus Taylorbacteria bacterium]
MKEFKKKKKLKSILYSRVSIVLLLILFFFIARSTYEVWGKQSESQGKKNQAQTELEKLKARQEELSGEISRLKTPEGIEEEIREKFKMAKENENMAIIVDTEEKKPAPVEKVGFFEGLVNSVKQFLP